MPLGLAVVPLVVHDVERLLASKDCASCWVAASTSSCHQMSALGPGHILVVRRTRAPSARRGSARVPHRLGLEGRCGASAVPPSAVMTTRSPSRGSAREGLRGEAPKITECGPRAGHRPASPRPPRDHRHVDGDPVPGLQPSSTRPLEPCTPCPLGRVGDGAVVASGSPTMEGTLSPRPLHVAVDTVVGGIDAAADEHFANGRSTRALVAVPRQVLACAATTPRVGRCLS